MTTTTCPHCNATTEWYAIPEAGLERCPNCFIGTQPITTKKATPQTKADPSKTKQDK